MGRTRAGTGPLGVWRMGLMRRVLSAFRVRVLRGTRSHCLLMSLACRKTRFVVYVHTHTHTHTHTHSVCVCVCARARVCACVCRHEHSTARAHTHTYTHGYRRYWSTRYRCRYRTSRFTTGSKGCSGRMYTTTPPMSSTTNPGRIRSRRCAY